LVRFGKDEELRSQVDMATGYKKREV
jgi:hypothetical protein